jgi:hypothetical protein
MWAGGPAMPSPGDPQAEPTIGKAINGGFDLLEAKCNLVAYRSSIQARLRERAVRCSLRTVSAGVSSHEAHASIGKPVR